MRFYSIYNMRRSRFQTVFCLLLILLAPAAMITAQEPADSVQIAADTTSLVPPDVTPVMAKNIIAEDNPNDDGEAIRVRWDLSVDDHEGGKVTVWASASTR